MSDIDAPDLLERQKVANDVYGRYGMAWADFPSGKIISEHSNEAELFCAKLSLAVYGVYPASLHNQIRDNIPVRAPLREIIRRGEFSYKAMFERGEGTEDGPFEADLGVRSITSDKAGALIVWKGDRVVIAFRGTANWQDWIWNFNFGSIAVETSPCLQHWRYFHEELDPKLFRKIRFHKGFQGLTASIVPPLRNALRDLRKTRNERLKITLCGHSLGGAIANIAGPIINPDREIEATYTYGAPKIAKGPAWVLLDDPRYRIVVVGDPVPRFPLSFSSDYEAAYLAKSSSEGMQPPSAFSKVLRALQTKLLSAISTDFDAHNIETYIEAIEAKMKAKAAVVVIPASIPSVSAQQTTA